MPTFEEVARSGLAAVDCDASYLLASQWAVERYQQLSSRVRFRHLRELGAVVVPATYSTGTIAATRDSAAVTGTSTVWTAALQGRYLRIKTNWYRVQAVVSATSLVLATPYTEETVTSATYKIIAKQIPLSPDARWISNTLVNPRMRWPLDKYSLAEFELQFPDRILTGSPPQAWCQTADTLDADGKLCLAVEVYPYPTNAETLNYVYWKRPPAFKSQDELPNVIDGYQLKEGILIDIAQYNASKYAKPDNFNIEAAAYWRNESRQQRTAWERVVLDVAKQDRGVDDLTFILQMTRSYGTGGAIRTARDEVFSRGNRP